MSTPRRNTRYLSLDEAVFDDSQPEFDAMAYARDEARTPTSATQLLGGYPPADTSYEAYYKNPRPSSQHFPQVAPQKRRKHPFADSHFEAPHWQDILIHAILCFLAYPLIFLFAFLASNKTLFWTRFIVGLGSGIIGVAVGTSLLRLAQAHLEATTWATVIHQSHVDESQPGVRLEDLDASTRDATVAGTISFVVGRLVEIKTALSHQLEIYEEIAVMGGNSDDDIARATSLAATFNVCNDPVLGFFYSNCVSLHLQDYALTWTLQPFTTNGGLPPVISFQFNETDTVYFSEVVTSQLIPGGNGFGDFGTQWVEVSTGIDKTKEVLTTPATQERPAHSKQYK
ncbi:hypothetical protein H0H81_007836 [Sphagnurus paluster]|uniref:Uncharacterized protein n=1 Tax=Sphagnurus paluster TaxID=117069 RepID=A0A9P7KKF3_9AGAR|nr:hypothetical protein H0H81_007836 [Sphagnurus paluster]